jgi:hypothetical protein
MIAVVLWLEFRRWVWRMTVPRGFMIIFAAAKLLGAPAIVGWSWWWLLCPFVPVFAAALLSRS